MSSKTFRAVPVPSDAGLKALIDDAVSHSVSQPVTQGLRALANTAARSPQDGAHTAQLPAPVAPAVGHDLLRALKRARESGHPAAGSLSAFVASQFGAADMARLARSQGTPEGGELAAFATQEFGVTA